MLVMLNTAKFQQMIDRRKKTQASSSPVGNIENKLLVQNEQQWTAVDIVTG